MCKVLKTVPGTEHALKLRWLFFNKWVPVECVKVFWLG